MHSSEKERLLTQVIENRDFKAFREEMFHAGRAELRRSRFRAAWRRHPLAWIAWSAMAASILAGAILVLNPGSESEQGMNPAESPKPTICIQSTAMDPKDVARSVADRGIIVETTRISSSSLAIVETRGSVPLADDAELLAVFAGRPSGLIRTAAGVQLVLMEDQSKAAR
jgi:hypothetical protein